MDAELSMFVSLTGATTEEATSYLEMAGGDPEVAANLYWEYSESGQRGSNSQRDTGMSFPDPDEVRAPIEARVDNLLGADRQFGFDAMSRGSGTYTNPTPFLDASNGCTPPTEGDLVFQQLFRSPSDICEEGSFATTKATAKSQEKWMLVNIQNNEDFACLALNRDVWGDETMQEFLKAAFLFWQRDHKSPEGQSFINYYKVTQVPHIAVIDPRTGRSVKQWPVSKFKDAFLAIELLSTFADSNPFTAPVVKRVPLPEIIKEEPPSLPELPQPGAAGTVRIACRLSSGAREQLSVLPDTKLAVLMQWAAAKEGVPISKVEVKTSHPAKSLRADFDLEIATISDASLAGSLLTITTC